MSSIEMYGNLVSIFFWY